MLGDSSKSKRTGWTPVLLRWGAWGGSSLFVLLLIGIAPIVVPGFVRPLREPPDCSVLIDELGRSTAEPKRAVRRADAPRSGAAQLAAPRIADRPTSPPTDQRRASARFSFERVALATRPVPDLTAVGEDQRAMAAEWNRKSDALTSAALRLLAESRSLPYSEVKTRMKRLEYSHVADVYKYRRLLRLKGTDAIVRVFEITVRYKCLAGLAYIEAASTHDDWLDAGWRQITTDSQYYCYRRGGFEGYQRIARDSYQTWYYDYLDPPFWSLSNGKSPSSVSHKQSEDWRKERERIQEQIREALSGEALR